MEKLSFSMLSTTVKLSLQTFSIPYSLSYGIQDTTRHTNDIGDVWSLKKEDIPPCLSALLKLPFLTYNCCSMDLYIVQITIVYSTRSLKTICSSVLDLQ